MDPYYLNSSDFARSEVLLGSLGLTLLILGHPLNSAGKGKLLTKTGERYNKKQLFDGAILNTTPGLVWSSFWKILFQEPI